MTPRLNRRGRQWAHRAATAALWLCGSFAHAAEPYESGSTKMPAALAAVLAEERATRLSQASLARACGRWSRHTTRTPLSLFGLSIGGAAGLTPRARSLGNCIKGPPAYAHDVIVGYSTLALLEADLLRCLPARDIHSALSTSVERGAFVTLNVEALQMTGAELECLANGGAVRYVEPDCNPMYTMRMKRGFVRGGDDGYRQWCEERFAAVGAAAGAVLEQIGISGSAQLQAEHVRVAVLDSGVNCSHEALSSRMGLTSGASCPVVGDSDMIDCDDLADGCPADGGKCDSHGTEMAGVIASDVANGMRGVAPAAELVSIRVTSVNPTRLSSLAKALHTAAKGGARVVNLSWDNEFESRALYEAIASVGPKTLVVTVSTDKSAPFPAMWSHDLPNLIAVAAVAEIGQAPASIRAGSAYAPGFLAAPGECVHSTTSYRDDGERYWYFRGVSSAAAYVSGAAAAVLGDSRFKDCSASEIKRLLVHCEATLHTNANDPTQKFGFLNISFLEKGLSAPKLCRDGRELPACALPAFQ